MKVKVDIVDYSINLKPCYKEVIEAKNLTSLAEKINNIPHIRGKDTLLNKEDIGSRMKFEWGEIIIRKNV